VNRFSRRGRDLLATALILSLAGVPARADPANAERFVAAARAHLGKPYRWEGRDTKPLPGLDCLGLVYRAHTEVAGGSWRKFSVMPTQLIASGKLGARIGPVYRSLETDADRGDLLPGDVLYFFWAIKNGDRSAARRSDGVALWIWHVGIASRGADGVLSVVHADPGGEVQEESLQSLIDRLGFEGFTATRPFPAHASPPVPAFKN
jgi:hypothetical protein